MLKQQQPSKDYSALKDKLTHKDRGASIVINQYTCTARDTMKYYNIVSNIKVLQIVSNIFQTVLMARFLHQSSRDINNSEEMEAEREREMASLLVNWDLGNLCFR